MAKKKTQKITQTLKRPPIVTVMGHVDHGKTTLLDYLRKTHVAEKESGGITQHIGAYQVEVKTKDGPYKVTFIDTPGHEAFTAMRLRGAQVTDIIVLVVAANEGVKPQTIEAINHAKSAKVPIVVAINKMDLASADPERVKSELLDKAKLAVEGLGGDTVCVNISAKTGKGVDDLLEMIHLVSEMKGMETDPLAPPQGVVLEAYQDPRQGLLVSIILTLGTLKAGSYIATASAMGKVKRLMDNQGRVIGSIGAGEPAEVSGFESLPKSGEVVAVFESEKEAEESVQSGSPLPPVLVQSEPAEMTLDAFFASENVSGYRYVVKADTHGSLEAIVSVLGQLSSAERLVELVHSGIGDVSNSDLLLARSSGAKILAFRVQIPASLRAEAKQESVDVQSFDVIYEMVDYVKEQMGVPLEIDTGVYKGKAEVLSVFEGSSGKRIAGCRLTLGRFKRGDGIRILRDSKVILESRVTTLRKVKEAVKIVNQKDQEFGLVIRDKDFVWEAGDIVEVH